MKLCHRAHCTACVFYAHLRCPSPGCRRIGASGSEGAILSSTGVGLGKCWVQGKGLPLIPNRSLNCVMPELTISHVIRYVVKSGVLGIVSGHIGFVGTAGVWVLCAYAVI